MKRFVFILISILIIGCQNKRNSEGIIEFKEDKSVKDWRCYQDKVEGTLCVPPIWKRRLNAETPFVFDLENENENSFFVLIRNDKEKGVNVFDYFRKVYEKLTSDSTARLKEYSASQLKFRDRYSYYGQFQKVQDGRSYYVFIMVSERGSSLFDFTLQVQATEADKYYAYFQNILYNYVYDGEYLFSRDDQLDAIEKFEF